MAKKDFDGDPGGLIGDAIFSAIKPLYKEGEKTKKTRRASSRRYYYAPEPKVSQKKIVFSVLAEAIRTPALSSAPETSITPPGRSATLIGSGKRARD